MQDKPCRHIWIDFVREGEFDRDKYDARRVCHYCKADLGFERHKRFDTPLGQAELLLDQGKLSPFDANMVRQYMAAKTLTDGQNKVLLQIVRSHANS